MSYLPNRPNVTKFSFKSFHVTDLTLLAKLGKLVTELREKAISLICLKQHIHVFWRKIFLQASRVFDHPHLVVSGHGSVKTTAPEMLQNMRVVSPEDSTRQKRSAEIPLYQEAKVGSPTVTVCRTPQGRALYIAYKDKNVLEK